MATRTLLRGLDVLEVLAAAGEFGLGPSAIGDKIGLDRATVTRLLRTLAEAGYVFQDRTTRRYRVTGKILRLANGVAVGLDLRRLAHPHLVALRQETSETVHLGVMEDLTVVYLDKMESTNTIQLVSVVGQAMPLHSTSLGKAILASLSDWEREAKYALMDFVPRTDRTIRDVATFREEIRRTQARGYAIDDRENEPLGACVAAAIIGSGDRPVGAISIAGPAYRILDHIDSFGEQVRSTAAAIGRELGAANGSVPSTLSADGKAGRVPRVAAAV